MTGRAAVRLAVAAAGFAVAGAVLVYSLRGPTPALPPALPPFDPSAELTSGPGDSFTIRDGTASLRVTYSAFRRYDDGRLQYDDADVRRLDDRGFRLKARRLEARGNSSGGEQPGQFSADGGLVVETGDGPVLESDRGTYDDAEEVVRLPGEVAFRRGRLTGRSQGARYELARDLVRLLDDASIEIAPDADGRGAASARAARMTMIRGQHSVLLEDRVRIEADGRILTGRTATLVFSEDDTAMKYLELRGAARMTPAAGAAAGAPEMSADGITMSFFPDGATLQHATLTGRAVLQTHEAGTRRSVRASWIDLFTARDGRTVTRLQARDRVVVDVPPEASTPARTITADRLEASGDETRGLTSARFDGSPRFEEAAPGPMRGGAAPEAAARTGTALTLVLALGGHLGAIERAEFQQNARFTDGRAEATADVAVYEAARDQLRLAPGPREPRRLAHVSTASMTVDATEIDLMLSTEDLDARGQVTTRSAGSGPGSRGALFDGAEPVYGTAARLEYRKSRNVATYVGAADRVARLRQNQTEVTGRRIEFNDQSGNLTAEGQVASVLILAGGDAAAPQRHRVQAESLVYDESARTAIYRGAPARLTTGEDATTEARTLVVELAPETRTLRSLRAETEVWGLVGGRYEVAGDVLTYRPADEVYTLIGKPARVLVPEAEGASARAPGARCRLSQSLTLDLDRRTGAVTIPGQSRVPSTTEPVPCSHDIRRGR